MCCLLRLAYFAHAWADFIFIIPRLQQFRFWAVVHCHPSDKLNPYHSPHLIFRTVVTIVQSVRSLVDVGSIHLYHYIHCNSKRFWIFLCYFYHQWLWKNSSLNPDGKHIVFAYEVWPCIVHGKDDFFSLEARMQIIFQTDTWNNKCTGLPAGFIFIFRSE